MARLLLWGVPLTIYIGFCFWYTDTAGPLTAAEVDTYITKFLEQDPNRLGADRFREFLASDTGRQFIMLNIIDMSEQPPDVEGANPGESAQQLMGRYMEYMYPALFSRACHPIFAGVAIAPAMDIVGIEGADQWDQGALMRYRSRRDLADIATNSIFAGRHDFKIAALDKTIAYPVEGVLYYSDPRFLLVLILFSLCSLVDLLVYRRR